MHTFTSLVVLSSVCASLQVSETVPTVQVVTAAHEATLQAGTQLWTSRYIFMRLSDISRFAALEFAHPLQSTSSIEASGETEIEVVVDEHGQLTGIKFDPNTPCMIMATKRQRRKGYCDISIAVRTPLLSQDKQMTLTPPLAQSDAVQRLHIDAGDDFVFELDEHYSLTRYLTHYAAAGVGDHQIGEVERMLGERIGLPEPGSIYLTYNASTSKYSGISGHMVSLRQHRNIVAGITGVGSVLAIAVLIFAFRYTGRIAQREQKKKELEKRFDRLREELETAQDTIDKLDA